MKNFLHSLAPKAWGLVALGLVLLSTTGLLGNHFSTGKSPVAAVDARQIDLTINGRVLDATTQEPLIGCTVVLKGSTVGTVTDVNGNFTLTVPDGNAVLVFSFIGYAAQEVALEGRTTLEVSLKTNDLELAQVVVVGYGSTTQRNLTGSAKSIKNEDFNRGVINSPEQLLQGRVSGVNVVSASGEPGSQQGITVRGPGGIRTGSTPLFVLDGLALDNSTTGGATNPLTFLNPQDIESIDVLKDASATAIYGARGANGVILITTKKGKSGVSTFNYNGSVALSNLTNPLEVFSAEEYRRQVPAVGGVLEDFNGNTDWQDVATRTAQTQNHNISLSGGAGNLSYYGSFGLQDQQGILLNSNLKLYSGRLNISQKFWDGRLVIDANLNGAHTFNQRPPIGTILGDIISINPTYPAYDAQGNINNFQTTFVNPLTSYELFNDEARINRLIGSITPSLTLAKGLVYKLNFGIDNATSTRDIQNFPSNQPRQEGRLATTATQNTNRLIENYLTYTLTKPNYGLTALAGHSYQRIFVFGRTYSINRFPISELEPVFNPGLGQDLSLVNNRPSSYVNVNELQSFFSRLNFDWKGKYLLTATVRADGSSKFGENNKYGVFPSFSAGWRISDEAFMQGSIFSDLKLRAGWGQTGNQEIPSKITQPLFTNSVSGTTSYPLTETGPFPAGTSFARLANPDLQWEVSTQTDLGLDFELFQGKITGTVDYFNKVSNNILLEVIPADPVQPATTFWTNVEDMKITNQGWEFELNYRHNNGRGFGFEIGGNLTLIDNVVTNSPYSVIPSGSASGSGLTSATINGYINNQPIGTFFLREHLGFDDRGLSVYRDVNGDGIVTDADRIAAGTALPSTLFNFNGSINFKGFTLSANLNGVSGNKIYDNTANAFFYKLRLSKGINVTPEAVENTESINNAAPVSTRFLKDGAFLRLNNATLNYTFNTDKLGIKKWVSTLNVFVTGQNLLLFTNYNGYDPEVNTDRTINGVLSYGIDYLSYPRARTVLFGVNLSF